MIMTEPRPSMSPGATSTLFGDRAMTTELRSLQAWRYLGFKPKAGEQPRATRKTARADAKLFDESQVCEIKPLPLVLENPDDPLADYLIAKGYRRRAD